MIVFENQVVFVISDLDRPPQVARFESALEDESLIVIVLLGVEGAQFGVVTIDFGHFLVESGGLAGRAVRVVLPVVDRVLLGWQLDKVILIDVRSVVVGIFLLWWIVEAIVHNLFSLALVHAAFSIDSGILFAHGRVELVNWLKVSAPVAMPRSISHERLINSSSGQLDVYLWSHACSRSLWSLSILLLICEQIFEIIVLLGQGAPRGSVRKHAVILGRNRLRRLLRQTVLELELGLVLTLAPHLVRTTGRHHLDLSVHLLLMLTTLLH